MQTSEGKEGEGGRRKEEGGRRKEEGGRRKEEGTRQNQKRRKNRKEDTQKENTSRKTAVCWEVNSPPKVCASRANSSWKRANLNFAIS
jgi:hypothetical protein